MSRVIYDSSAVDRYISELSKREAEVTRERAINNYIKEVPYLVFKWGGMLLILGIFVWILGHAVSNAQSYQKIIKNENLNTFNYGDNQFTNDTSKDHVIDVEELLANNNSESEVFPTIEEPAQSVDSVRDYYIFDTVPFVGKYFNEVIIGRTFDAPNSPPTLEYCYVNIAQSNGTSIKVDFISIDQDGRFVHDLDEEISKSVSVPLHELKQARSKCTI